MRMLLLARRTELAALHRARLEHRGRGGDRRGARQAPAGLRRVAAQLSRLLRRGLRQAQRHDLPQLPGAEVGQGPRGAVGGAAARACSTSTSSDDFTIPFARRSPARRSTTRPAATTASRRAWPICSRKASRPRPAQHQPLCRRILDRRRQAVRPLSAQGHHRDRQRRRHRHHRPEPETQADARRPPLRLRLQHLGRVGVRRLPGDDHGARQRAGRERRVDRSRKASASSFPPARPRSPMMTSRRLGSRKSVGVDGAKLEYHRRRPRRPLAGGTGGPAASVVRLLAVLAPDGRRLARVRHLLPSTSTRSARAADWRDFASPQGWHAPSTLMLDALHIERCSARRQFDGRHCRRRRSLRPRASDREARAGRHRRPHDRREAGFPRGAGRLDRRRRRTDRSPSGWSMRLLARRPAIRKSSTRSSTWWRMPTRPSWARC